MLEQSCKLVITRKVDLQQMYLSLLELSLSLLMCIFFSNYLEIKRLASKILENIFY